MSSDEGISAGFIMFLLTLLLILIGFGMWGCPQYQVYQQKLTGKAALERATQDRQIRVQEAQAEYEAAQLLNKAEIARAEGLAAATNIAVKEFGTPEDYLRYLWIDKVAGSNNQIIYIPTEAGMPVMEATRMLEIPAPQTSE